MRKCSQAVFQSEVEYGFSAKHRTRRREGRYGSERGSVNKSTY